MRFKKSIYYLILFIGGFVSNTQSEIIEKRKNNSFVLMIDPAGDAQHKGRSIDAIFEQSISFALAQALQKEIEEVLPNSRVIITHNTREIVRPLATANFANRSEADLFLSIHCYQTDQLIPQLTLYRFSYGEYSPTIRNNVAFYPYDQAHFISSQKNKEYGNLMKSSLQKYTKQFELVGLFEIPFKPLMGITIPALGIEIGLKNKKEWYNFIKPFTESIVELVAQR